MAVLIAYFIINIFHPVSNKQTQLASAGSREGHHIKTVVNVAYCVEKMVTIRLSCQSASSDGLRKTKPGRQVDHFYRELSHHS